MVSSQKIAIIDIGIGNINSVYNAIYHVGYDPVVVKESSLLDEFQHIILPGVGHFSTGAIRLTNSGFSEKIKHLSKNGHYILGICLGMQLLFNDSEEAPKEKGLSLINGSVKQFPNKREFPIPHIGWNNLSIVTNDPILEGINNNLDFYFVHSFHANCQEDFILGYSDYSINFPAVVKNKNIYGIQFHPEKSQENGLIILENFCRL